MKKGKRNLFILLFVVVFTFIGMQLSQENQTNLLAGTILFSGVAITLILLSANKFLRK